MRVATDLPNSGWVALIVTAFGLCWSLSIDGGFQGFDDLHYLEAAQHWLQFGPYIPQDHWASRLPLVLSFTAGLAIWGPDSTALIVPSVIFYLIVVFCCWNLGRLICGPQKAISFILILVATPMVFRIPTSFYPEGLEAASALSMITLALYGMWEREGFVRDVMLVGAGVCGGLALLVRETAIAVPIAISIVLLWDNRASLGSGFRCVFLMALGTAIPVVIECIYYLIMVGNPLYRLVIDSRHVLIPSDHLNGKIYTGGSPLFNWELARMWSPPSVFHLHWTINGFINLFASPAATLVPLLGVLGCWKAWREGGRMRSFALLVFILVILQYIVNTFVLVIAPNVRYLIDAVVLLACMAGYFILSLKSKLMTVVLLGAVYACGAIIGFAQPSAMPAVRALRQFSKDGPIIYVPQGIADMSYLERLQNAELNQKVSIGEAPIGALAAKMNLNGDEAALKEQCSDGRDKWIIVDTAYDVESVPYFVVKYLGIDKYMPETILQYLRRSTERMSLARRVC